MSSYTKNRGHTQDDPRCLILVERIFIPIERLYVLYTYMMLMETKQPNVRWDIKSSSEVSQPSSQIMRLRIDMPIDRDVEITA